MRNLHTHAFDQQHRDIPLDCIAPLQAKVVFGTNYHELVFFLQQPVLLRRTKEIAEINLLF